MVKLLLTMALILVPPTDGEPLLLYIAATTCRHENASTHGKPEGSTCRSKAGDLLGFNVGVTDPTNSS